MTDMRQGLILAGTGLDFRGRDYINREVVQQLAYTVVEELQPCYGYCTGICGWNGAWGRALIDKGIPYTMVLPYLTMGTNWYQGSRAELYMYTSYAQEVVYMADSYYQEVYQDRDKYLVLRVEGVVALDRPLIKVSRVVTLAKELGIPVLDLWHRYNHTVLDD